MRIPVWTVRNVRIDIGPCDPIAHSAWVYSASERSYRAWILRQSTLEGLFHKLLSLGRIVRDGRRVCTQTRIGLAYRDE